MRGIKVWKVNSLPSNITSSLLKDVHNYLTINKIDEIFTLDDNRLSDLGSQLPYKLSSIDTAFSILHSKGALELLDRQFAHHKSIYEGLTTGTTDYSRKCGIFNKYGLTPQELLELESKNQGTCEICGKTETELEEKLHVDHDHKTGKVRGLLCANCNKGLGMFCDDIQKLKSAMNYLSK